MSKFLLLANRPGKSTPRLAVLVAGTALSLLPVSFTSHALQITNYDPATNNRFTSGYPLAPVENADPAYVGLGLDWAGVGWDASNASKSFGFLSPAHYLVASHFSGAGNLRIFSSESVHTGSQASVENTGFGLVFEGIPDLSLGTLSAPFQPSSGIPRYAVLDLNPGSTSNNPSAYSNLPVLLYGRGPNANSSTRIGATTINSVVSNASSQYFTTPRTSVQLEGGDSGSPAIHRWTNPDGIDEITVLGNHAAVSETSNFINFTGTHQVMSALNGLMNDDGFALRVTGNPLATWVGNTTTDINRDSAWGIGGFLGRFSTGATSDQFVAFDGGTAGSRTVNVNVNYNLRGLFFLSTPAADDSFTLSGGNTLTIGRGGITNYDHTPQIITAAIRLADSQVWHGGPGGITTGPIATEGKLLEFSSIGVTRITGAISGSGSIAVSSGTVELTASNTYSGATRVHAGTLLTANSTGSSTGTGPVTISAHAALAGSGLLQGSTSISGIHRPGNEVGLQSFGTALTYLSGARIEFDLVGNTSDAVYRGLAFDAINIAGNLDFGDAVTVELSFQNPSSIVDWNDPFWGNNSAGPEGWLLFQVGGQTSGFSNLSLLETNWIDSFGTSLNAARPHASFSFHQIDQDIHLSYSAVPEPATVLLLAAGFLAMAWLPFRRNSQCNAGENPRQLQRN